jgi:hypothetical protein
MKEQINNLIGNSVMDSVFRTTYSPVANQVYELVYYSAFILVWNSINDSVSASIIDDF